MNPIRIITQTNHAHIPIRVIILLMEVAITSSFVKESKLSPKCKRHIPFLAPVD